MQDRGHLGTEFLFSTEHVWILQRHGEAGSLTKRKMLSPLPLAPFSASKTLGCPGGGDVVRAWLCGRDCMLRNRFLSGPILQAAVFSTGFQLDTVCKVSRLTKKEYIHQRREKCHSLRTLSAIHWASHNFLWSFLVYR